VRGEDRQLLPVQRSSKAIKHFRWWILFFA